MVRIFPSLISADLLNLEREILEIDPYVSGYHLDVMDFHFVPNLTWGPSFINRIRRVTYKPLYIHLMVDYPEKYFKHFSLQKGDTVAIHYESPSLFTPLELFTIIQSYNLIPSIALKPSTALDVVFSLEESLSDVLIMSVEPGFSGQTFIPAIKEKIAALASWKRAHNLSFTISVDGGINRSNFGELVRLGADQLAIASAIFSDPNRLDAIKNISKNC